MTRSKSKHPIAIVRRAAGKTAQQFADYIGVSVSTVKQIECGSRSLTEDTARSISRMTGANAVALLKGRALTANGDAYTPEVFHKHASKLKKGQQWKSGVILSWIELALDASESSKHGARFKAELVTFINKTIRDCALQAAIDRELAAIPHFIQCVVRGDELVNNPELLKYDADKKDRKIEDLSLLDTIRLEIPLGAFPRIWRKDMAVPPPPRADSIYGRL